MSLIFDGFHGTSFENARLIIKNNYEPSTGDSEWLGDGVYFFIDGLSKKPTSLAENWTIAQSWCNIEKKQKYKTYSVLKSRIEVNKKKALDLTTSDGIEILDYIIKLHSDKMREINKRMTYIDGFVINFVRLEGIMSIDVAKGNFYIKFKEERIKNINRRSPNCTICSVYNLENIKDKELLFTKEVE